MMSSFKKDTLLNQMLNETYSNLLNNDLKRENDGLDLSYKGLTNNDISLIKKFSDTSLAFASVEIIQGSNFFRLNLKGLCIDCPKTLKFYSRLVDSNVSVFNKKEDDDLFIKAISPLLHKKIESIVKIKFENGTDCFLFLENEQLKMLDGLLSKAV